MKTEGIIDNFIEYLNTIVPNDRLTIKQYSERLTTVDIVCVDSDFSMLSLFITDTELVTFEIRNGESLSESFNPPDRSFTDFELAKKYVYDFISCQDKK